MGVKEAEMVVALEEEDAEAAEAERGKEVALREREAGTAEGLVGVD